MNIDYIRFKISQALNSGATEDLKRSIKSEFEREVAAGKDPVRLYAHYLENFFPDSSFTLLESESSYMERLLLPLKEATMNKPKSALQVFHDNGGINRDEKLKARWNLKKGLELEKSSEPAKKILKVVNDEGKQTATANVQLNKKVVRLQLDITK